MTKPCPNASPSHLASPLVRTAAFVVASAVFVGACDDDPTEPPDDLIFTSSLVFEREDGSTMDIGPDPFVAVWCGPWDSVVDTPSLHVVTNASGVTRGWSLDVVLADVTLGAPLSFPNVFLAGQPGGAALFVLDPPNELSTGVQDLGAGGSLTFQQLDCEGGNGIAFTVDAVLASEFGGGGSMRVFGAFSSEVGEVPPA